VIAEDDHLLGPLLLGESAGGSGAYNSYDLWSTSTTKVLATTAGAALGGPVGGAVATVLADAAVAVAVPRLERTPARR
jgi:hypothetical protein